MPLLIIVHDYCFGLSSCRASVCHSESSCCVHCLLILCHFLSVGNIYASDVFLIHSVFILFDELQRKMPGLVNPDLVQYVPELGKQLLDKNLPLVCS